MTQDERLQRAWIALCGWKVGMVDVAGRVVTKATDDVVFLGDSRAIFTPSQLMPALDSPANCGHWTVALYGDAYPPHIPWTKDYPRRLLLNYMVGRGDMPWPPEVLDWWKHEQEAASGNA